MEALVDTLASTTQVIAGALLSEGLNANGHADAASGITMKNGEPMLVLKDRFMLATFAKALNAARSIAKDNAKDPDGVAVEAGPDIPALAQAAGYGAWPRKSWPSRAKP